MKEGEAIEDVNEWKATFCAKAKKIGSPGKNLKKLSLKGPIKLDHKFLKDWFGERGESNSALRQITISESGHEAAALVKRQSVRTQDDDETHLFVWTQLTLAN